MTANLITIERKIIIMRREGIWKIPDYERVRRKNKNNYKPNLTFDLTLILAPMWYRKELLCLEGRKEDKCRAIFKRRD